MVRLLPAAFALLAVGFAAYAGSFYATSTVLAHGQHCGVGGNPGCNTGNSRYYASQNGNVSYFSGFSNGIEGTIQAQDLAVLDANHDFIANFLGMTRGGGSLEWAQVGFWEGVSQGGVKNSPVLYFEYQDGCGVYRWNTAPSFYNPDYPEVAWYGESKVCGPTGRVVYKYYLKRMGGTTFDYAWASDALMRFDGTTEHFDNTHMEPNGTQRFGNIVSIYLYNRDGSYYTAWDTTRATTVLEQAGYVHNPVTMWSEFTTTGQW